MSSRRRPKRMNKVNQATKKFVQKQIEKNIETKFRSTYYNRQAIPTTSGTPLTATLTNQAQNDTQTGRTGNQIYVTGFHYQGIFESKAIPAGTGRANVRFVLYIPKHNADDELSTIDVFTEIDQDKYTVLYDEMFPVSVEQARKFKIRRKWNRGVKRGIKVQFDGTAAADLAKNPIKLYCVSDNSGDNPLITAHGKLYYKDA